MTILITVLGIVQGVGFRPFVARLAKELAIKGTVINSGGVVIINANSNDEKAIDQFIYRLKNMQPEGAHVIETRTQIIPDREFDGFDILESDKSFQESPLIPVDLPMCENCKRELYDSSNRRYLYPFISCVACGPRYSIIKELPYDRETITMNVFGMCKECESEYKENTDRRCHAQTISCHDCGPQLILDEYETKNETKKVKGKAVNKYTDNKIKDCLISENTIYKNQNALNRTIELLMQGKVLAIKGIGGYQFVCLPTDKDAVDKLRLFKRRDKKPFAIMFPDMQSIMELCECCDDEEKLLLSTARPIVLLNKKNYTDNTNNINNTNNTNNTDIIPDDDFNSKDREKKTNNTYFSLTSNDIRNSPSTNNPKQTEICHDVCGESQLIGAFLPYTPLHQLLTDACGPLVMTSGNITSEPIIISDAEMLLLLESQYDKGTQDSQINSESHGAHKDVRHQSPYLTGVLYNERQILTPLDDSITRIIRTSKYQDLQTAVDNENEENIRNDVDNYQKNIKISENSKANQKSSYYQPQPIKSNASQNTSSNIKQIIRRSRGYVPSPLILDKSTSAGILALGGDMKSCFCLYQNERAYLSQYFGDMENYKVLTSYKENIERMKNLFGIVPDIISCDLHPQYFTTRLAQEIIQRNQFITRSNAISQSGIQMNSQSTTTTTTQLRSLSLSLSKSNSQSKSNSKYPILIQVQHHHAHAASVMAEHNLDSCIGVIFDGTGYGTDGAIWGGEFLLCKEKQYERRAHLGYVTLCGGDQVAKDSKLASQCYLVAAKNKDSNIFEPNNISTENYSYDFGIIKAALEQHINTFESSSMGRLFDAVSAILDIKKENTFEGECAIALEKSAFEYVQGLKTKIQKHIPKEYNDIKFDIDYNSKEIIIDQVGIFNKIFIELTKMKLVDLNNKIKETYHSDSINLSTNHLQTIAAPSTTTTPTPTPTTTANRDIINLNQNHQGLLAYAFHNAIIEMVIDVCIHLRIENGENKVALSGGVFANMLILKGCINGLGDCGFQVFINNEVPTNDGGISLGQAWLCRKELIQKD